MKKTLLSVFGLCSSLSLMAQFQQGLHADYAGGGYALDQITSQMSVQDVYWWTQKADSAVTVYKYDEDNDVCNESSEIFRYSWVREPAPSGGVMKYTLDQPYGKYEPVGVTFGEGKTLDISKENAYLGFSFKNTSSITVRLKVALQDINGKLINSMPMSATPGGPIVHKTQVQDYWMEEVKFDVAAGERIDTVINWNISRYPLVRPYYPVYVKPSCDISDPAQTTKDETFDYTKLSGVTFTVVDFEQISGDGYKNPRLEGATFELGHFYIGKRVVGLGEDEAVAKANFRVFPNPIASGSLKLNFEAHNVKVVDVLGNVVFSAVTASEIDVTNLNKGVYTLQSSKGTARFVVE